MKFLEKYKNHIYALLRIIAGLLFIPHGIQKITGFLNGNIPFDNYTMILAALIETLGGFFILIGWNTRLAAFIASGQMAFAYFIAHASGGLLPINNKGEMAVLFSFVFLLIASFGGGIWSIDNIKTK